MDEADAKMIDAAWVALRAMFPPGYAPAIVIGLSIAPVEPGRRMICRGLEENADHRTRLQVAFQLLGFLPERPRGGAGV